MPPPTGPRRPSPDELAKQIAARLAETGEANSRRFSLSDSVLVGRLVSGTIVLSTAAVLVLGIFAGVDLLLDDASAGPTAEPPQVLSLEVTGEDDPDPTNGVPTTPNLGDLIGLFAENPAETTGLGLVTTTIPGAVGIGVPMPGVSNPSTTASAGGASTTVGTNTTPPAEVTTTSTPAAVTTSQLPTTSSSGASMTTTSTSTSTVPMPTIPATTTTVTIPSTTVPTTLTIPTTTTIEASTTTLFEDTTTTCGNKGGGKGNC